MTKQQETTSREKLREQLAIATQSDCDIIVAIPNYASSDLEVAKRLASSLNIRGTLNDHLFPYFLHGAGFSFIYGLKDKLSEPTYEENFLKKCAGFSDVTIKTF